jgi:hypothetical protein
VTTDFWRSAQQHRWIQVALQRNAISDLRANVAQLNRPVKANGLATGLLDHLLGPMTPTLYKDNDGDVGIARAQLANNERQGLKGEPRDLGGW